MKKSTSLLFGLILSLTLPLFAQDTTWVQSHQQTHWNWYGNFYDTTQFPETGTYERILMHYTIGCPSIGCSEWDYTTKIEVGDVINDSTTQWYELVRIMTPYAGDRQEGWTHEWVVDVTDYAPLLTGERPIKAHYSGYQDGFTVTVDFEFIEGVPSRKVLSIDQVYHGTFKYGFAADPIEDHLVPTDVDIVTGMESAKFRYVASGHSFGGNENCAEFCKKYYQLKVNGSQLAQRDIWRDDCGDNPLQPQTGTWIYERAGWCPGDETVRYDDEVGDELVAGQTASINVDMEGYNYTGGAGFDPQWIIEGVLFQYGPWTGDVDVSIDRVIRPSLDDEYKHLNPICGNPVIQVSNQSGTAVTSMLIKYWVDGGFLQLEHEWQGTLESAETVQIELPAEDWKLFATKTNDVFHAEILEVNGQEDEIAQNNTISTAFEEPEIYPSNIIIAFQNNQAANETSYRIENSAGEEVFEHGSFGAGETASDTVELETGCYTFIVEDGGCDGLDFFANSAGSGKLWVHPGGGASFFPPLNIVDPQFGCTKQFSFTVGYALGVDEAQEEELNSTLFAYPNPSNGHLTLTAEKGFEEGQVSIIGQFGQLVKLLEVGSQNSVEIVGLSSGVYFATYSSKTGNTTTRFVVTK